VAVSKFKQTSSPKPITSFLELAIVRDHLLTDNYFSEATRKEKVVDAEDHPIRQSRGCCNTCVKPVTTPTVFLSAKENQAWVTFSSRYRIRDHLSKCEMAEEV
jgi:hypothetical protein